MWGVRSSWLVRVGFAVSMVQFFMKDSNLYRYLDLRWREHSPRSLPGKGMREAAVLVALTESQGEVSLLLTERSQYLPTHKGEVAFPGGKVDSEDLSLIDTALREAHEEVGLAPESVAIVGELDQVTSKHGFLVTPVLSVIPADVQLEADPGELSCYFKAPLKLFYEPSGDYLLRGKVKIPSYQYEGFRIWGLTAYVIAEMMNRYFDAEIDLAG